jgi:hypothetical protein
MGKVVRCLFVVTTLVVFGLATIAVAADFYVAKDAAGKATVVDKKPADAKMIVSGPFKTKEEAEKAMAGKAAGSAKKPPKLPEQGC